MNAIAFSRNFRNFSWTEITCLRKEVAVGKREFGEVNHEIFYMPE